MPYAQGSIGAFKKCSEMWRLFPIPTGVAKAAGHEPRERGQIWEYRFCRNTHEREIHTRTIENDRSKSSYWGTFTQFHGEFSQIYLLD